MLDETFGSKHLKKKLNLFQLSGIGFMLIRPHTLFINLANQNRILLVIFFHGFIETIESL